MTGDTFGAMSPAGILRTTDSRRAGADLEALRRIGPAARLVAMPPTGVTRAELTVPIAPDGRVDDTVLFEDPADASRFYYLPRYRLRVGEFSGMYEITTELVEGRWRMTFGLESFPAPEIKATGRDAAILPHDLSVSVTSGSVLLRDYPVAEFSRGVTDTVFLPELVLLLTLQERDALLRAFTRDEEHAQIEVRRTISIAVPAVPFNTGWHTLVATIPDNLGTHVILPDLVLADFATPFPVPIRGVGQLHGGTFQPGGIGQEVTFQPSSIVNDGTTPQPDLVVDGGGFQVDGAFQPGGAFEAGGIFHAGGAFEAGGVFQPGGILQPGGIVIDHIFDPGDIFLPGGGIDIADPDPTPDPTPDPPTEPRFTVTSTTLPVSVPLRFDVDAHPYLFPSGQPSAGGGGFATLVVAWPPEGASARNHVYFQDQAAGDVFYYLPDVFLVGQRDEAPYGPELSFTVGRTTDAGGGAERAIALMSVHLVPQTSPARLHHAEEALAAHLPAGSAKPELRPAVHPAVCRLQLPGAAVTTAAPPDLVRGWWVAEAFGFDDLRDVYAVLTTGGGASALLRGRVDVDVMGQVHQVPVEVRLERLASPPLSWTEVEEDDADRSVRVTLRNDGEVTVVVPVLPAWVDAGGASVPAVVTGALPARLAPGDTVSLTVTPRDALEGTDPADASLDVTGVRTVVDPDVAVEQTLDRRVARLPRVVTVLTTEGGLGSTGDPERDLALIGVQFDGVTGVVILNRQMLQIDVAVPVPLLDWLLDRGSGEFRYRQTLVRVSGTSETDAVARSADTGLLVLPAPRLPS